MPLMYGIPNIINITQTIVLRGSGQLQTDKALLGIPPSYSHATTSTQGTAGESHAVTYASPHGDKPATDTLTKLTGGTQIRSSIQRNGIRLFRWELMNAAAAASVGIGFRLDSVPMSVGRLAADDVTYTDISASVKARTEVAIQVAGADQTGFVVAYPKKFSWLCAEVTTAETDAGGATVPDHGVYYSQNGNTWAAFTGGYTDNWTGTNFLWDVNNGDASGPIHTFVWEPASDWAPNDGSLMAGQFTGCYLLRFTSAQREGSDAAAKITGLEIGSLLEVKEVASKGVYTHDLSAFTRGDADGVVAYFSVANAGNHVYAEWEPMTA